MKTELPIIMWFVGSGLSYFVVDGFLRRFLQRQEIKLIGFWLGTPGYLDLLYAKWCIEHKQLLYIPVIALRALLIVSTIVAALAARHLHSS
jgi:hypothetical protein